MKRLEIHTEVITTLTTISEQMRIYGDLQSELRKSHFLYVTTDQASTSAFKVSQYNTILNKTIIMFDCFLFSAIIVSLNTN